MNLTVTQPVSPRYPKQDQFELWFQNEGGPVLSGLRSFANQREQSQATLTTAATGTYTTIWSETPPDTSAWLVTAHVVGRSTAGGVARAAYQISGLFYREVTLAQQGATTTVASFESIAAFDARFSVSGNELQVQVIDDGARTMNWNAVVVVQEVR